MSAHSGNEGATLGRREFLVAAGAAAAVAYLPFTEPVAAAVAAPAPAPLADWTVDDMWGVYPRPHEAIGYGRPRDDGELLAAVHPADLAFLA